MSSKLFYQTLLNLLILQTLSNDSKTNPRDNNNVQPSVSETNPPTDKHASGHIPISNREVIEGPLFKGKPSEIKCLLYSIFRGKNSEKLLAIIKDDESPNPKLKKKNGEFLTYTVKEYSLTCLWIELVGDVKFHR